MIMSHYGISVVINGRLYDSQGVLKTGARKKTCPDLTEMLAIMKRIWTAAIPVYLRRIVYAAQHTHMKTVAQPVFWSCTKLFVMKRINRPLLSCYFVIFKSVTVLFFCAIEKTTMDNLQYVFLYVLQRVIWVWNGMKVNKQLGQWILLHMRSNLVIVAQQHSIATYSQFCTNRVTVLCCH